MLNILVLSLIILLFDTRKKSEYLLLFLVTVGFLIALKSVFEIPLLFYSNNPVHDMGRTFSFLGWSTATAGVLLLFIPGLIISKRWLFLSVFMVGFLATKSVLPLMALFVTLAIMNKKRFFWALAPIIVFTIAIRGDIISQIGVRYGYISDAVHRIMEHPFIGSGAFLHTGTSPTAYVHNSYLQIWVEHGLIGFILMMILVYVIIRTKPSNDIERCIYWGLIAFLIDNVNNFTLLRETTAIFFWAMFACYLTMKIIEPQNPKNIKSPIT